MALAVALVPTTAAAQTGPNLVVNSVDAPEVLRTFWAQEEATVEICNLGDTPAFGFSVALALSTDDVYDLGDQPLATRFAMQLEPTQCERMAMLFPAPYGNGNPSWIVAEVDSDHVISESDEFDNTGASAPVGLGSGPDLFIREVRAPASADGPFTADVIVCNQGDMEAFGVEVRLYASLDEVLEPHAQNPSSPDVLLGTASAMNPGFGLCERVQIIANSPPWPPGTAYIGATVNETATTNELLLTNNASALRPLVLGFGPDLVVDAYDAPSHADGPFVATVTVCNQGSDFAPSTEVALYAASTEAIDPLTDPMIGSQFVPNLYPSQCADVEVSAFAPTTPGAAYVGALVDPMDTVFELDETNGLEVYGPFGFGAGPDLAVTALALENAAGSLNANVTVCNLGSGYANPSTVDFIASEDEVIGDPMSMPMAWDQMAGSASIDGLAPGQCASVTAGVWLPTFDLPRVYLGARVQDPGGLVADNDLQSVFHSKTGFPRFVVDRLQVVRNRIDPWAPSEVELRLCNRGTVGGAPFLINVVGSAWPDFVSPFAASPTVNGYVDVPSALEAGQCTTLRGPLLFSDVPGEYFLAALPDPFGALAQDYQMTVAGPFGLGDGPNLYTREIALPASADQAFVAAVQVCNDGDQSASASQVALYASLDARIESPMTNPWTQDVLLGYADVPSLLAEACVTVDVDAMPPGLQGPHYVGIVLDEANSVVELMESDNLRIEGPMGFGFGPDLVVSDLTFPPSANAAFEVTFEVCNQGTDVAPSTDVALFASADQIIDDGPSSADVALLSQPVPSLQAGECRAITASAWAPPVGPGPGPWYLGPILDGQDNVLELVERPDPVFGPISFGDGPDVIVTHVALPASADGPFEVTITGCNQGTATSPQASVTLFASADTELELPSETPWSPDQPIGTALLPSLEPEQCGAVTLSAYASGLIGTVHVAAIVDETDAIAELSETNNVAFVGTMAYGAGPNYVVRNLAVTRDAAQGFDEIEVTACNEGTQPGTTFETLFGVSRDGYFPEGWTFLDHTYNAGGVVFDALAPGECQTRATGADVFQGPGAYYVAARIDPLQLTAELRRDDNQYVTGPVALGSGVNLTVSQVILPPSADSNFDLSVKVCNESFDSASPATDVTLYASSDVEVHSPVLFPWSTDASVGYVSVPGLQPGECQTAFVTGYVPAVSPGAYYIGAIVDEGNTVSELLETDNIGVAGPMGLGFGPDLVVSALDMPNSVESWFDATVTVCNQGTAQASSTDVALYSSLDEVLETRFFTDAFLGSAPVPPLEAGQCTEVPMLVGGNYLPQTRLHVLGIVDTVDNVFELREDNQVTAFGPYGFGSGPNLVVSDIALPPSAQFDLHQEITVCNFGTQPSPSTDVSTYASTDAAISTPPSPNSYGLGFASVPPLEVGRCATVSIDSPTPPSPGAYYVGAIVDQVDNVGELIEDDNTTVAGPIGVGSAPDFIVKRVAAVPGVYPNPNSIQVEVCNQGTAPGDPGYVEVFASLTGEVSLPYSGPSSQATPIGYVPSPGTLEPGTCASATDPYLNLPAPPGAWYIVAGVDLFDTQVELLEDNNITRVGPVGLGWGPNLVVDALDLPLAADGAFVARAKVCNVGFDASSTSTQISLFASSDETIESPAQAPWTTDAAIGFATVPDIAPGRCTQVNIDASSPPSPAGAYFVGAIVDDPDTVWELLETDNVRVEGPIGLGAGPLLVAEQLVAPAVSAGALDASVVVCNEGTMASSPTNLTVIASADADVEAPPFYDDLPFAGAPVPGLESGACAAVPVVGAPLPGPDGAYYLGVLPDDPDSVPELVEGRAPVVFGPFGFGFGPDLVVSQVSLPPSSQGNFTADVTVCNQGTADAPGADFTLVASSDRVLDSLTAPGGDLPIGGGQTAPLVAGACETVSVPVNVPVPSGVEHIGLIVDEQDNLLELLEANNLSWWGPMAFGFGPDLVVRSAALPPVLAGPGLTGQVTVCNDGTDASAPAFAGLFATLQPDDWSAIPPVQPDDPLQIGWANVNALAAGACETVPADLFEPYFSAGAPSGAAYVAAMVDVPDMIIELSEDNNLRVLGQIGYGYGPELRVAAVTGPAFASPGQEITAAIRVCNDGNDVANPTSVRLFASTDDTLDVRGLDPEIGMASTPSIPASSCVDIDVPTAGFGLLTEGAWRLGAQVDLEQTSGDLVPDNNAGLGDVVQIAVVYCGNGAVDPGEQCDDGNFTSGDGCTAACVVEFCGDGVVNMAEVCDDGNSLPYDGCSPACVPQGALLGEVLQISANQSGSGATWYPLSFAVPLVNPVVVGHTLSFNGGDPTHLRVRNVSGTGFEWNQEEWDYKDGNHTTETLPFLAMEAGRHVLEDGKDVEAGTVSATNGWVTVTFSQPFSSTPVLLTGVMSDVDSAAVVVRTRNLSATGFEARVQEEEVADGTHAAETVAFVALEPGVGLDAGMAFESGRTADAVTHNWYGLSFSAGFSSAPVLLANMDTFDGGDTAGLRYQSLSATGAQVKVEEEQSRESETGHTTERVSWFVWEAPGPIVAAP